MDRANVPPVDGESVWRRPTPGKRLSLDLVPKSWLIALVVCPQSSDQQSPRQQPSIKPSFPGETTNGKYSMSWKNSRMSWDSESLWFTEKTAAVKNVQIRCHSRDCCGNRCLPFTPFRSPPSFMLVTLRLLTVWVFVTAHFRKN